MIDVTDIQAQIQHRKKLQQIYCTFANHLQTTKYSAFMILAGPVWGIDFQPKLLVRSYTRCRKSSPLRLLLIFHHHTTQPSYGPFSGTTRVSQCQKRTSGIYGAGKINRGRHTDHPAGRHSIRTNQCPPPPSPPYFYGADALPAECRPINSVKALKALIFANISVIL